MIFFNKINCKILNKDIYSITLLSILIFYIFISLYAIIVFQQFSIVEILMCSFCFFTIFSLFSYFCKDSFFNKFAFTYVNLFKSLLLTIIMIVVFFNDAPWLEYYYSTYPFIETDSGVFWHEDTAYHVALIQSIINFGYPSVGLHDIVPQYYHVLSHYVDALIILIIKVEAYDSYGLLFFFKKWLLISTILFFIVNVIKESNIFLYFILVLLTLPFILYTWHAIGSHGLWFTMIVLLFFIPKIVDLLQKEDINNNNFIFIFAIVIIISIGKVSTGFMLGVFIGFYLLLKNIKDLRIYLVGLLWIIFFALFAYLIAPLDGELVIEDIHKYKYNGFVNFLFNINAEYFNNLLFVYLIALISYVLGCKYNNKSLKLFTYSSILSIFSMWILVRISIFSIHDIWYFTYGLYSVSFLIFYMFIIKFSTIEKFNNKIYIISFLFILALTIQVGFINNFYSLDNAIGRFYSKYFQKINSRYLTNEEYYSIKKILLSKSRIDFPPSILGLEEFRKKLELFMSINNFTKKNTLLFIPKKVYHTELSGKRWSRGMLIYSITGVPLIYGVGDNRSGYGFGKYLKNNIYTDIVDKNIICQSKKNIIYIKNIKEHIFEIMCKKN